MVTSNLYADRPQGQVIWTSKQGFTLNALTGPEAKAYFDEIADIRINLFKEYPYLYEGSKDYERSYLETYFKSGNATILLAFDKGKVVGFSNSIPLIEEAEDFKKPFLDRHLQVSDYLYLGEVMLYPPYRRKGAMGVMMRYHDERAQKLGFKKICLVTSRRPKNHPMKPKNYRSLDPVWTHFGYKKENDFTMQFKWKQVDTKTEELNILDIWQKTL